MIDLYLPATGDKMIPESKRYTATVGSRTVTFETGKLAGQAGGAVTVGINDAIVFGLVLWLLGLLLLAGWAWFRGQRLKANT